jgi:hypothetical protein
MEIGRTRGIDPCPDLDAIRTQLLTYQFLNTVDPCDREVWDYLRRHEVDVDAVIEPAGPIGRFRVAFDDFWRFERNDAGEHGLVHLIHGEDAEFCVDLIAWSMFRPHLFGTYLGVGAILGADQISKPRCQLWQKPLDWLRSECHGACILDCELAADPLRRAPGPFVAQNVAHAHELIRLMPGVFGARGHLLVNRRAVA